MTESSRRQAIVKALAAYAEKEGTKDTLRVPLRGHLLVEVVELPLDVPLLNVDSFRIAPQLTDHPRGDFVLANPESDEAQAIVAELIKKVHRNVDQLKENLLDEGQAQPGVITRSGRLINGNTRCVLLRELAREGRGRTTTVRVAVLPSDVGNEELLELEMVLQQQVELKDEYRLISELVMIKKLHEAGFTDEAIAKRRRFRQSGTTTAGQKVKDRREVLMLMERARRLPDPAVPLTAFDSDVGQLQSWLELLGQVRQLDAQHGSAAGDDHIRRWLIAYFSGVDSVHRLRHATGEWVERDLLDRLGGSAEVAAAVDDGPSEERPTPAAPHQPATPAGLDLLGDPTAVASPAAPPAVGRLLNAVAQARQSGATDDATDGLLADVRVGVEKALDEQKRRARAGSRVLRPQHELTRARTSLRAAADAIADVAQDAEFASHRESTLELAREAQTLANQIVRNLRTPAAAGE